MKKSREVQRKVQFQVSVSSFSLKDLMNIATRKTNEFIKEKEKNLKTATSSEDTKTRTQDLISNQMRYIINKKICSLKESENHFDESKFNLENSQKPRNSKDEEVQQTVVQIDTKTINPIDSELISLLYGTISSILPSIEFQVVIPSPSAS
jgi:hypothetical protein